MSTAIVMTTARLGDVRERTEFLSAIPNGDRLDKLLDHRRVSSRAYDDATWTARFVASDGRVVKCFAVTEITIDQAEMIAAVDLDIAGMDEAAFREAVRVALGPTLDAGDA